ncbi:DUF2190 family protein [Rhodomicrobium vannielii ATCC 17100]|nr:DUF2190 family protein [Rhodomicrobium vannielii ATCC 17100]
MRNYIRRGDVIRTTAPAAGSESGQGLLYGAIFGVACAASGDDIELVLKGLFELAKGMGAIGAGAKVYWEADSVVTATATGNTLIGVAVAAAAEAAATARVRLSGAAV